MTDNTTKPRKRPRGRPRKPDALTGRDRMRRLRQKRRDREAWARAHPEAANQWWQNLSEFDKGWWCGRANSEAMIDAYAAFCALSMHEDNQAEDDQEQTKEGKRDV